MKNYKVFVAILSALLFTLSCDTEEDLSIINPNEVVVSTFYKNADELRSGVFSIYATLQSLQMYAREYFFVHDLRGDDNKSGGGQLETPRNQLLIGTNDPANPVATDVWNGLYRMILRSNIVITQGPSVPDISENLRTALIAEAKFTRGWAYFELGSLWGGAPIYTTFATSFEDGAPKSSQQEVLNQAIQDLQEAAAGLPVASQTEQKGRFSKGSALAMLGRVYMFIGDYANAKTVFDQVVDSGEYALVAEYDDNFQEENEYNEESIVEIGYADIGGFNWDGTGDGVGNEHSVRTQEYSAVGWRNLIPSEGLLNEFERTLKGDAKNDPRFEKSFYTLGDTFNNGQSILEDVQGEETTFEGVTTKISWRKYSLMYKVDPGGFLTGGINMRVIRYAEVLLNLAESELELGNTARAIELLNQVRSRPSVAMPPYPTASFPVSNSTEIMEAIIHEKRVELSSEQIRNRDILRWRKEGKLAVDPIAHFVPRLELLPIPQSELDNNAQMSQADQNPGY
ncbi:RagB/SusD family nutrient uptake outer membrane protein [Arenibacter sp. GZD96]|uniref:RagB/SusD family nutrient uptake outer membrane protein n=1 Tax=Aurantibrevibacter litoralis TaxID=3106030 RepID=UPI002AFF63C4|nr:RagB/SusD family nutrient uptake outer membrane protein [Arenibacter sp. GZD-96]MEA1786216.1 RagB/SusD family nutrient uptake outer membrane protein [Arenibacter sp. GZD-96]